MDFEASQHLQRELSSGESLRWAGRPKQGLTFRGSDALMIPFSLLWGGGAIFWEFGVYTAGAPDFFLLVGGVFVVVGLYLIFGRFIVDSLMRKSTYYGVTDDRVLILAEFPVRKIRSLQLRSLAEISLSSSSHQRGMIRFGPGQPYSSWMMGTPWPGMERHQSPSFELIADAKSVCEMIQNLQKKAYASGR